VAVLMRGSINNRPIPASARVVEFSPDATQIASADPMGTIRIWDRQKLTMRRLFAERKPNDNFGGTGVLTYSPDGKKLLSIEGEQANKERTYFARLWDPANGQQLLSIAIAQDFCCFPPSFSPDSKLLVLSDNEGGATVYTPAAAKSYAS
jgi:WD40 repeat protein